MPLFVLLSLFSFVLQLYAAPQQGVAAAGAPAQDAGQLLTDEWALREHLAEKDGTYAPELPLDSLTLVLFDDQTYQLTRTRPASVEWGKWELNDNNDLISVQVTNLDGYSTLSAMLGRWRIRKLTPQQLILKPFGAGNQYLVFERAR
ncbi:hypothetical protein [Pontibacter russatus]|uniref:hypothetical protein n=1 Tax=Pontibacter russatus TaxID=2694929 RepID=UPI001379C4EC|nr:hypothetical protein [Pontibacter russatus]